MATIHKSKNNTNVIIMDGARVVVPDEYPILNPEMLPETKCVWIGALRRSDGSLPEHVIWLADKSFEEDSDPDTDTVLKAYFAISGATVEQQKRFYRWNEILEKYMKEHTPELGKEILYGDHNTLGMWPVIPGSLAEEYYFTDFGGDDVA